MLILRRPARKNSGQLPPMENRQLMQRARCRNIQQLYMTVVRRIFFLRRVKQKYRVKLQPFRVGYRKHHDAVPELLRLSFCAVLYRNVLCQPGRNPLCLLFVPTDHRDGLVSFSLPALYRLRRPVKQRPLSLHRFHADPVAMADDRFHRIDGKIPVAQNLVRICRDLHRVAVAFPQKPKGVIVAGQDESAQFIPVIQAVLKMDILRGIAHDRVGAARQARIHAPVCHHPEVLRLIDHHMACLPDRVCLLDPLVDIGQRRQIIDVKGVPRRGYFPATGCLRRQEILIERIDRSLPFSLSKIHRVFPVEPLFLFCRKRDVSSQDLILISGVDNLPQHQHFALHGIRRMLL